MLNRAAWQTGIQLNFPAFSGNADADVVIVGGGLTGVTTALMLASLGQSVILLEKDELGCGATQACTGKVSAHQPEIYAGIYRSAGRPAARAYAGLMQECVQDIHALLQRLDQPLGVQPAVMAAYAASGRDLPTLRRYAALEDSLDLPIVIVPNRLPHRETEQAVALDDQLMLEPLGYLAAMAHLCHVMGCRIYEHSPVTHYAEHRVQTDHGVIRAAWVILCTGYPLELRGAAVMPLMQQRVLETRLLRTSQPLRQCWLDVTGSGLNLRPVRQGILLSADLGYAGVSHKRKQAQVNDRLAKLIPDAHELQRMHRQDVWTMDSLPMIGPVSPSKPHLLMACGYSGWGLTGSMLAARVLSGIIGSQPLSETPLLRPHRTYPGHTVQQLRGDAVLLTHALGGWRHPTAPVCPHMGCRLSYQPLSRRWECPCHGSSFDPSGACMTAPAARAAKVPARH